MNFLCKSLRNVSLWRKYPGAEAFEACGSLCTVALPQQLRYIGHRAFAECSKLVCLTYRSTKASRRRLHVAANAFEGRQALTIPGGFAHPCMAVKALTQGPMNHSKTGETR